MRIYIEKVIFNSIIYTNSIEYEGVFDSLEGAVDFLKNTEITDFLKTTHAKEDTVAYMKVI